MTILPLYLLQISSKIELEVEPDEVDLKKFVDILLNPDKNEAGETKMDKLRSKMIKLSKSVKSEFKAEIFCKDVGTVSLVLHAEEGSFGDIIYPILTKL